MRPIRAEWSGWKNELIEKQRPGWVKGWPSKQAAVRKADEAFGELTQSVDCDKRVSKPKLWLSWWKEKSTRAFLHGAWESIRGSTIAYIVNISSFPQISAPPLDTFHPQALFPSFQLSLRASSSLGIYEYSFFQTHWFPGFKLESPRAI